MAKRYTVAQFKKAIPGSGGVILTIAQRVGCDWYTARTHIDASPTLYRMWQNERETLLDMSESVLFNSIKNGSSADAKWHLVMMGKDRGWNRRVEVTGADGGALTVNLTWGDGDGSDA